MPRLPTAAEMEFLDECSDLLASGTVHFPKDGLVPADPHAQFLLLNGYIADDYSDADLLDDMIADERSANAFILA